MLKLCCPDIIVERLEQLDQEELLDRGISALLLDLDNTLCPWQSREISPERREWVQRASQHFKLCIVSNTFKSRRLLAVGESLGIPTIGRWGLGRKPFRGGIQAALKLIGAKPRETAIIGDQVFADILGGNRVGLLTVWVPPLAPREFSSTRLVRGLERLVLRQLGCQVPGVEPPPKRPPG